MKIITISTFLFVVSTVVNAESITHLAITGGSFSQAGAGGIINSAAFANITVGGYDGYDPGVLDIYGTEAEYVSASIATFTYGFYGPTGIYTSSTDSYGNGPFAPVTGDITDSTLTLDLSSWTMSWYGLSLNQGGTIVTTINEDGDFTATWQSIFNGGPWNGGTGSWSITGNASIVPVPAAGWLFGSGLIGLICAGRRKYSYIIFTSTKK